MLRLPSFNPLRNIPASTRFPSLDMKILLLGSTGLLGSTLSTFLASRDDELITHSRSEGAQFQADLSSPKEAIDLLRKIQPGVIINLVGLTNVDLCEAQPNQAYLLNVRTVENVTNWIRQEGKSCHLVHISTDQLYDGINNLHAEECVTLTNYYAFSKYAGELAAASVSSTILRTNFFGRSHCPKRTSLSDWLFRALSNNDLIEVFDDVLFSPIAMSTLSEMIELSMRTKPVGVFNLGSHDGLSKADFAFAFADELGLPGRAMKRTTSNQVTFLKTYRPKDMRMSSAKFERALGVRLPKLRDEIKRVAKEYREIA
jgi:dTDP-4-dehydrorhamnose reductase